MSGHDTPYIIDAIDKLLPEDRQTIRQWDRLIESAIDETTRAKMERLRDLAWSQAVRNLATQDDYQNQPQTRSTPVIVRTARPLIYLSAIFSTIAVALVLYTLLTRPTQVYSDEIIDVFDKSPAEAGKTIVCVNIEKTQPFTAYWLSIRFEVDREIATLPGNSRVYAKGGDPARVCDAFLLPSKYQVILQRQKMGGE